MSLKIPTFAPGRISLKSLRRSRLLTSSGLLIGSGYLSWQLYSYYTLDTSHIEDSQFLKPTFAEDEEDVIITRLHQRHWKLLRDSNRERHAGRAIKELHKMRHLLNAGVMTQISQSLSLEASVALARCPQPDPRFFRRPPPLPASLMGVPSTQLFAGVLSSLPMASEAEKSYHPCIDRLSREALLSYMPNSDDEGVTDSDLSNEFHRESHHMADIPRKRISGEVLTEACLSAILSHSTLRAHVEILLEDTLLLPLLQRLLSEYSESPKIKCLIGKILANISLYPEFHKRLFGGGWVGILAAWKEDPNLLISLPASKALANLDQAYLGHKYEPGVYLLQTPRERSSLDSSKVDVVFIHGLLGGVFYSWRQGDPKNERGWGSNNLVTSKDYSVCWPRDWIQDDMESEVRILGIDFDTYLSQWGGPCPNESFCSTLQERSADILRKLKESGVGRQARRVVLVGHSMGGILIKQLLLLASSSADEEDSTFLKNVKGVLFYGTPHLGSELASLNATSRFLFFPSTEVSELASGSPALAHPPWPPYTPASSSGRRADGISRY